MFDVLVRSSRLRLPGEEPYPGFFLSRATPILLVGPSLRILEYGRSAVRGGLTVGLMSLRTWCPARSRVLGLAFCLFRRKPFLHRCPQTRSINCQDESESSES